MLVQEFHLMILLFDFNFKDTEPQEIANIISGDELKVEVDENGDDVILMRLNRFLDMNWLHSINCSHQLNLTSGISWSI